MKKVRLYHLDGKLLFRISLAVIVLTILAVYFWGLGSHRTFYQNSLISTTTLSIFFFVFISAGLYKGVHVEGNHELDFSISDATPDFTVDLLPSTDGPIDFGDGIAEAIAAILLWIFAAILFAVLLWLLSAIMGAVVTIFSFMLYWIFLRALRLVFRNSLRCKGKLFDSVTTGLTYTILYNFWIYAIFIITEYLQR